MKLTDGNAPGGGVPPPEVSVRAASAAPEPEPAAGLLTEDEDTLGQSVERLVDATKELGQAELAWAKALGAFLAKRTLVITVAAVVALIIAFGMIVTLMLGAMLALAPLIGLGLAVLAVTGAALLALLICGLVIKGSVSRIIGVFA